MDINRNHSSKSDTMRFCTKCGSPVEVEQAYCKKCGKQLIKVTDDPASRNRQSEDGLDTPKPKRKIIKIIRKIVIIVVVVIALIILYFALMALHDTKANEKLLQGTWEYSEPGTASKYGSREVLVFDDGNVTYWNYDTDVTGSDVGEAYQVEGTYEVNINKLTTTLNGHEEEFLIKKNQYDEPVFYSVGYAPGRTFEKQ